MPIKIHSVAHHRNGVAGNGFYVVLFDDPEADVPGGTKVGVVFDGPDEDDPEKCTGDCAVLDVALLAAGDIGFGSNSWRGDRYEGDLRRAAAAYKAARRAASLNEIRNALAAPGLKLKGE